MSVLVSVSFAFQYLTFVFCGWSRPTNKRNREQKHKTKKLLPKRPLAMLSVLKLGKNVQRHDRGHSDSISNSSFFSIKKESLN